MVTASHDEDNGDRTSITRSVAGSTDHTQQVHRNEDKLLYTIDRLGYSPHPRSIHPNKPSRLHANKPLDLVVFLLDIPHVHLLDIRDLEEVLRAGTAHAQDSALALAVLLLALETADFGSAVLLFVLTVGLKSLANLHVSFQKGGDICCEVLTCIRTRPWSSLCRRRRPCRRRAPRGRKRWRWFSCCLVGFGLW